MSGLRSLLGALTTAFAVAAIVAPAAMPGPRPDDRPGARGPGAIAQSQEHFVPGVTDFPSRLGTSGERAANTRIASGAARPVLIRVDEAGFDWRDAGIGALGTTAVMLVAAFGVIVVRRGRVAVA
jgi:hypothetical protein